jgi:nitrogen fixation/metabolism regulation signal transduction histidine kinase
MKRKRQDQQQNELVQEFENMIIENQKQQKQQKPEKRKVNSSIKKIDHVLDAILNNPTVMTQLNRENLDGMNSQQRIKYHIRRNKIAQATLNRHLKDLERRNKKLEDENSRLQKRLEQLKNKK